MQSKLDWNAINLSTMSNEERIVFYLESLKKIKGASKVRKQKERILTIIKIMEDKKCLKM